eukprot:364388-Chlamydomonas_euryale.AAC.5
MYDHTAAPDPAPDQTKTDHKLTRHSGVGMSRSVAEPYPSWPGRNSRCVLAVSSIHRLRSPSTTLDRERNASFTVQITVATTVQGENSLGADPLPAALVQKPRSGGRTFRRARFTDAVEAKCASHRITLVGVAAFEREPKVGAAVLRSDLQEETVWCIHAQAACHALARADPFATLHFARFATLPQTNTHAGTP